MKATVERSIEAEERKMGLVIIKALYGKLQGSDDGWDKVFFFVLLIKVLTG